jgi:ribosomal protein L11 methylase PrmA
VSGARRVAASFRDPSGFVFRSGGVLYRQVNQPYQEHFDRLVQSGLQDELVNERLLVPTEPAGLELAPEQGATAVLRPEPVPTISYPYEWSFGQLKDAALLTLEVVRRALGAGMILKDASAYNVQFLRGRPILIDTLSFETYREGEPWIAYRQFCQHFLAPLALMALVDVRLSSLLRMHIDGIPLDLASKLLPGSTRLRPGLLVHVHVHGKALSQPATENPKTASVSKTALFALVDNLRSTVEGLRWEPKGTQWAAYYEDTNYTEPAMAEKRRQVTNLLQKISPKPTTCWDLGANTGEFSRIAARLGMDTVAWDVDPGAVERAYAWVKAADEPHILPLLQDLTNPSPGLGWASQERDSLTARGPVGVVMALALVHHLAISNNVPLPRIAEFFASLGEWALVEFVPKEDSQVRRLLGSRRDIFTDYHEEGFERAMATAFTIEARVPIEGAARSLYLLRRTVR